MLLQAGEEDWQTVWNIQNWSRMPRMLTVSVKRYRLAEVNAAIPISLPKWKSLMDGSGKLI